MWEATVNRPQVRNKDVNGTTLLRTMRRERSKKKFEDWQSMIVESLQLNVWRGKIMTSNLFHFFSLHGNFVTRWVFLLTHIFEAKALHGSLHISLVLDTRAKLLSFVNNIVLVSTELTLSPFVACNTHSSLLLLSIVASLAESPLRRFLSAVCE